MAPVNEVFDSWWPGALRNPPIVAGGLILACLVSVAIYRLYLSPLASFPGPKIAALTSWYACYYDLVAGGQYIWVVEEIHKKYGPIVRIRPDVLSVNDPKFIERLYAGSNKRREKYKTTIDGVYVPGSVLATKDHDLHSRRRAALNPFFSKQSVRRVEPIIQRTLSKLLNRMEEWGRLGVPAPMKLAYKATTKDIIHAYAFGNTHDKDFLDMKDMGKTFFEIMEPSRTAQLGVYFGWFNPLMAKLPPALLVKLYPSLKKFIAYINSLEEQIAGIRAGKGNADVENTVFHKILASDMPDSEKSGVRLREDAYVLVVAGAETTAGTLAAITYELLSKPAMLRKLKAELETAIPDPNERPATSKLEGLPYLNAVIQEAIRRYPGVSHRLDRVAPDEDLHYQAPNGRAYTIRAGTPVGMTAPLINRNESLYPSPLEFRPDRFLENTKLLKYQFSFSRGSRICLGINLAYQELYLLVAGIFRNYDLYDGMGIQKGPTLELYETVEADVDIFADYITPGSKPGSKGVQLIVRN